MTLLPDQHTALLLVDIQEGFRSPQGGQRNNPHAEAQAARLLARWRERGWPVIHIQHLSNEPDSPLKKGSAGAAFQATVQPLPGEMVLTKSVNSAFIGTGLEELLHAQGLTGLVIAGLTTDHCVSTTTRMAGNLGFQTWLVGDATATFGKVDAQGRAFDAETLHQAHLASLHGEFAQVVQTEELLRD